MHCHSSQLSRHCPHVRERGQAEDKASPSSLQLCAHLHSSWLKRGLFRKAFLSLLNDETLCSTPGHSRGTHSPWETQFPHLDHNFPCEHCWGNLARANRGHPQICVVPRLPTVPSEWRSQGFRQRPSEFPLPQTTLAACSVFPSALDTLSPHPFVPLLHAILQAGKPCPPRQGPPPPEVLRDHWLAIMAVLTHGSLSKALAL